MKNINVSADLQQIINEAKKSFASCNDAHHLENEKARYLGKSGILTSRLKTLNQLEHNERKLVGAQTNAAKQEIEQALVEQREILANLLLNQSLAAEKIDVTLPGRKRDKGNLHPVMQTRERIEQIFASIGFDVADGPEIENEWCNFSALNSPSNHPARSMQDTFYLDRNDENERPLLLRTHTSPMQIRYAKSHQPPYKVIMPGRTYRVDSDATHSPMFNQVEGLWIDQNINFADLKGLYTHFLKTFFEDDNLVVRFRPSYFPFTEPSAEIDMKFETGVHAGRWLEISGAGQVHPKVLKNMGLESEKFTGFAFGSGLERLTMLRYGIDDLRLFFDGDLRFIEQFKF